MDKISDWIYSFPYIHRKILFIGVAALCWTIWKTRNEASFQSKFPKDPANVVFFVVLLVEVLGGSSEG